MANQIECHGCLRQFDEPDARWVRAFESGVVEGSVVHTFGGIHPAPVPGGVPYCPKCLAELLAAQKGD